MKLIFKKLAKILLVLIASIIITYLVLTIKDVIAWCNKNQIILFGKDYSSNILEKIESKEIQEIGDSVNALYKMLEDSLDESYYEEDSNYHSIAEYYDPLGFAVWRYMQGGIGDISARYIRISILSGFSITIAYVVITSKKMNNILKLLVGYLGVMLLFPPVYMYSYTYRFWDFATTYIYAAPKYFYIGYTIVFVLIYVINYKIGKKMANDLNNTIKNKNN